ncbi:hypothetical protein UFOVP54_130 [uncultured Caudovirales phage]|uniref:Uncharacterized protein n=1 Tax=uncultured Caudovirales phage TaxID=2100421 RepID=A0A6J5KU02_9CAUD|nr:hypothetical protein UFOVP54_130 [uncultured Caudovirales phage]
MEKVGLVLAALGMLSVTAIVLAWPTQLLWNGCLVGAVDGINPIGFWQALGLNFLFGILIKPNSNNK